jgi:hypothetical protein
MNYIDSLNTVPAIRVRAVSGAESKNRPAWHGRESGTALVMALVILMILTILGISSMNTSIMEERMSGNIQDLNRAFEAAESGLSRAINTAGAFDLFKETQNDFDFGTGSSATKAHVVTKYLGSTKPKPGTGYSAVNFDAANFDQVSTGQTGIAETGAKVELHQGASQIINKSQ